MLLFFINNLMGVFTSCSYAIGYPTQLGNCDAASVLCRGGKLCISNNKLCDGKRDCPDGFDEESCIKRCLKTSTGMVFFLLRA